ncbi:MAG: hypothetical protein M1839_003200 [Geoglossum umbratile]|nr:MAG: hypothetical protein M1839_003200 [Geoglossum umbratile]
MAPLDITVNGTSTMRRAPERGILSIAVISQGDSQPTVTSEVTSASNSLQKLFKELSTESATAPVTAFSMTSLRTRSWVLDSESKPNQRMYEASSNFGVTFRDLEKLAEVSTGLFVMPHVEVRDTSWTLTEETWESLDSECRKKALLDAVQKAQDYAGVLGRDVVAVEVRDHSSGMVGMPLLRAGPQSYRTKQAEVIALDPGDVQLVASVTVRFTAVE